MHHRFANMLQSVRGLLGRHARSVDAVACSDAFEKADAQLQAFGLLHERLRRRDAEGGPASTCCAAYLADVCAALSDGCLEPRGHALSFASVSPIPLPERTCRHIGLLVTELVLNASKHAFAGRARGVVTVELRESRGEGLMLVVADDGVGIPQAPAAATGQGLRFVEILARSVGARCILSTDAGGTRYEFTIGGFRSQSGDEGLGERR